MKATEGNHTPANLTYEEYNSLVLVDRKYYPELLNYYYIQTNEYIRYYIPNPLDDIIQEKGIKFISQQKMRPQNLLEPVIYVIDDNRLVKGWSAILEYYNLEDITIHRKYLENIFKRYSRFTPSQVRFVGMHQNHKREFPIFQKEKDSSTRGWGIAGLVNLFPYTPKEVLYDYYYSDKRLWNYKGEILEVGDLIKYYEVKSDGKLYFIKNKSYSSFKNFINGLREESLIITRKLEDDLRRELTKKSFIDRLLEDKIFKVEGFTTKEFNKEGEFLKIYPSKAALQREYKLSYNQLQRFWEVISDGK